MRVFGNLFGRERSTKNDPADAPTGDMRDTPVNNPFDFRADGSIRPGDPAYAVMMEMMDSGKPIIGNQRDDGTWNVSEIGEGKES